MTVEKLREAAALIRSRAEVATGASHHWDSNPAHVGVGRVFCGQVLVAKTDETMGGEHANAEHIASWHPAVGIAVADWLEVTATDVGTSSLAFHAALAFANAYLGESA